MYREVPDALQVAVTPACPVQKARQLLATEQGLLSWLAAKAHFRPEVGAEYRLEVGHGYGPIEGRVQGYDPGSGIAYTFTDDWKQAEVGSDAW